MKTRTFDEPSAGGRATAAARVWLVADAADLGVATLGAETSIGTAMDLTLASGRGHVVVVDERGALLDVVPLVVLSTALLAGLLTRFQPLAAAVVPDAPGVAADAELAEAVEVMLAADLDAVGVVDPRGRAVGLLTWADVGRFATAPEHLGS
ncbi:CBS domain-containing protein [Nocardioides caricicola]|uniref:CBS domain-containing protein n=1 Tax=Nocardioides caricicola TaxID=634770 RepID=A0ABW0N8A5_9ACTN